MDNLKNNIQQEREMLNSLVGLLNNVKDLFKGEDVKDFENYLHLCDKRLHFLELINKLMDDKVKNKLEIDIYLNALDKIQEELDKLIDKIHTINKHCALGLSQSFNQLKDKLEEIKPQDEEILVKKRGNFVLVLNEEELKEIKDKPFEITLDEDITIGMITIKVK